MDVGFLYIIYKNFDKEQDELLFFNEALCSIKSLRNFTKLPIYIKTDYPNFFEHQGIENLFIEAFTRTPDLEYRTHQKLLSLKALPFGLTFFVDSDTLFLSNPEVLISRYDKCVDIFIKRDGMTYEEAVEWMEFNVVGAWVGETTPIFVHEIPSGQKIDDFLEEMGFDKPLNDN